MVDLILASSPFINKISRMPRHLLNLADMVGLSSRYLLDKNEQQENAE